MAANYAPGAASTNYSLLKTPRYPPRMVGQTDDKAMGQADSPGLASQNQKRVVKIPYISQKHHDFFEMASEFTL